MVIEAVEIHQSGIGSNEGHHISAGMALREGDADPGVEVSSSGKGPWGVFQVAEHVDEHGLIATSDGASIEDKVVVIVGTVVEEHALRVSLHKQIVASRLSADPESMEECIFSATVIPKRINIACVYLVNLGLVGSATDISHRCDAKESIKVNCWLGGSDARGSCIGRFGAGTAG